MLEWLLHVFKTPVYIPVIVALVAAAVSLFSALVTIINVRVASRTTSVIASRSVYINSVTAERSKWIDALRCSIADYAGSAERVISRRNDSKYEQSAEWATDVQSLRSNLSNLKLRLNPREAIAKNLIVAARKVDQAARLFRWEDVDLASEIMVRHGQWVLKFEWNRVKMEAALGAELEKLKQTDVELKKDYEAFLKADGSLHRLNAIGGGKDTLTITLLRSEMDAEI